MPPTLRSSQSGSAASQTLLAGDVEGDVLEPVQELFPFCGTSSDDVTAPGEWPFDRQCILRLPEDLGQKLADCLREALERGAEAPEPDLQLRPLLPRRPGPGRHVGRVWEVRAFGESLTGTLVDLPCHVESHVLPGGAQEGGGTAYKAADVSQMLLVHRGPEPPEAAECLDRRTFQWASGLTPPTRRIRRRKFRGRPPPGSEFAPERIPEAVAAIRERMNGEPYVYEELSEVDEALYLEVLRTQPENVWRPPPEQARATPAAVMVASSSSAMAGGSTASAAGAPSGMRKAASSILSTSSGGSAGGSTIVAKGGSRGRKAGSAVSDGANSGSAAMAESGAGEAEKRRRLRVT